MPGDITITAEIATQIDDIVICAHDMLFRFAVKFTDGSTKLAFLSISEELIFEDNTAVKITTPRGEPKYCRRGQYQKCGVSLDEGRISAKVNGEIYMHDGKYLLEDDEGNNHLGIVTINPASKKIKPALH
jgi:aminopeptidase-like protein